MTNPIPADVERLIAETEAARMPETIFVWLNPAPDHYGGGWDTDPTNRNIRYVRHDVVDAALRAMQAENGILRTEKHADAEAIGDLQAKLAEVEKERDAVVHDLDRLKESETHELNRAEAAEATVATLTAQVEAMRGALKYYKDTFCEGFCKDDCWSDEGHSHPDLQRDCSGCLAASVLIPLAALTTENQNGG